MNQDYRGRRILVVGLGASGLAVLELLASKGAELVGSDRRGRDELGGRLAGLERKGIELVFGSQTPELLDGVELVVVSPGVPPRLPLVVEAQRRGIPVWSELEVGFREVRGAVVAITGTKGKSTTASLVAAMLRADGRETKLLGNIGAPLAGGVLDHSPETVFVLEVSSFQLKHIARFRPDVAVLLDVSPDHLDWHPDFEDYVRSKARIFENQRESDRAVVFGGNPLTVEMASRGRSRKIYFDLECLEGMYPHVHEDGPWIVKHEDGRTTPLVSLEEFHLPGRHNRLNAIAASAAASLLGASVEAIARELEHFRGLPHALEKVADIDGVRFYNDSKATNIQAVRAALESFDSGILLILGGRFKGGDLRDLREPAARSVKHVFAIGESRKRIAEALRGAVPVSLCSELESAVRRAHRRAVKGDVVLLSPAGSSFDMFRDYRERGERFREIVRGLTAKRVE